MHPTTPTRQLGLFQATLVGVGAIVGGGVLALAGVAFASAGPAALLAFALNGLIAFLTALSFAEMASAFPQSGGTYTFAKKAFSVQAAFAVGWVVWFASIVAAVLYGLGFGAFSVTALRYLWPDGPGWLAGNWAATAAAVPATAFYARSLMRNPTGGGTWINVGKVIVFAVLIVGGVVALLRGQPLDWQAAWQPFFANGLGGLFQAMGYTFIALQGFDLIAAVAGDVRQPERNVPRAMFLALTLALLIYLPLLFVVGSVGPAPGESVTTLAQAQPEALMAIAARNYLGEFGYWLVLTAGILSMLSALQANLLAASRVAQTMARDRTLPSRLATADAQTNAPRNAIGATAVIVIALLLVLPDVAAAGAASSLIFLVTFALAHLIAWLLRRRRGADVFPFRAPFFPLVPALGMIGCAALAAFQGWMVPSAGLVALLWLVAGGGLFLFFLAQRAATVDAAAEAHDPELTRLRGRTPLILVPVANPDNAPSLLFVANALVPPVVGRIVLLSILTEREQVQAVLDAQRRSLQTALDLGVAPELLTTLGSAPWPEIARVARAYHCQSLLLGLSRLSQAAQAWEELVSEVEADVIVLRPPYPGWDVTRAQRVLVPVSVGGPHDPLRARLLATLYRSSRPTITFLQVAAPGATADARQQMRNALRRYGAEELPNDVEPEALVVAGADVADELIALADRYDLIIMGMQRIGRHRRSMSALSRKVADAVETALILITRHG